MSTQLESSFKIEDVLSLPQTSSNEKEPKIEELLSKLKKLQEAKLVIEEEVKEALSFKSTLQGEEDALSIEVLKLERTLNEKEGAAYCLAHMYSIVFYRLKHPQNKVFYACLIDFHVHMIIETCRSLQLKCEELEQESQRQFELKQQKEELVNQYSCQIQETKLRHRKIRMKFENQLQQLMRQHKNLYTIFTPERLPTEVQSAEYTRQQLLKTEQQKLEQVTHLQEELSKDRPQMLRH